MPSVNDNFFNITVESTYGSCTYKVAAVNNSGERIRLHQDHIESLTPKLQIMLQRMLHGTTKETKTRLSQALSQSGGGLRFRQNRLIYAYNRNPSERLKLIEGIRNNYFPTSMNHGDQSPLFSPIESPAESPLLLQGLTREDEADSIVHASPIPRGCVRPQARRPSVESPEIQPVPPSVTLETRTDSLFDDVHEQEDDGTTSYAEYPYTYARAQRPLTPDLSEADRSHLDATSSINEEDDVPLEPTQHKRPETRAWYNPMRYLSREIKTKRPDSPDANEAFLSALNKRVRERRLSGSTINET